VPQTARSPIWWRRTGRALARYQ